MMTQTVRKQARERAREEMKTETEEINKNKMAANTK